MTVRGHFTPAQLKRLDKILDDLASEQPISTGDRERLGQVIIGLAKSDFSSEAELRRRLQKAARDTLLESGRFLEQRLRTVSLQEVLAFRHSKEVIH